MIYAVDRNLDQIREKKDREFDAILKQDKYYYFDHEWDARDFIRNRAQKAVRDAERALDSAVARSRKCYRKFPPIKLGERPNAAERDSSKDQK